MLDFHCFVVIADDKYFFSLIYSQFCYEIMQMKEIYQTDKVQIEFDKNF